MGALRNLELLVNEWSGDFAVAVRPRAENANGARTRPLTLERSAVFTSRHFLANSHERPRNLRECEAEAVAMLCCAALDLPGVAFGVRYIQNWWGPGKILKRSARRILKTVDQILEAGRALRRMTRIDREGYGHSAGRVPTVGSYFARCPRSSVVVAVWTDTIRPT